MRLPIKALKELGNKYQYDVVVAYAWDEKNKMEHVATWGRTIKLCDQAAQWGNMMKDALGWPKNLHAIPNRVKKLQDKIKELIDQFAFLEKFHPRAMKLMKKQKNFVVVAEDEPYFIKVYDLIRKHEQEKGTWTDEDELLFKAAWDKRTEEKT